MVGSEIETVIRNKMIAAAELGMSADNSAKFVWTGVLDHLKAALLDNRSVALTGLCTLSVYTRKATQYRHPETHELMQAPERRQLRLALSPSMKTVL